MNEIKVLSEALMSLLRERDFLGLQLDFAHGNIDRVEFVQRTKPFLQDHSQCDSDLLLGKLKTLVRLIHIRLDSETISVLFGCSIEQAEDVLFSYCKG